MGKEQITRGSFKPRLSRRGSILIKNADFSAMQKRLEEVFFPSGALTFLYEAGKAYGQSSAKRLMGQLGTSVEDLLQAIADAKKAEGWGTIIFQNLAKQNPYGRIIVKNSFEAREYGKSTIPVCHFLRGYLAGVLSAILIPKARTHKIGLVETRCIAKGDKHCKFRTVKEVTQRD